MIKKCHSSLFLILIFISSSSLALESTDVLQTKILKGYNKNILVLNRGLEDSIFKKDHIKLSSQEGFIARAICLKSTMQTSHWKIYRVIRPELVSMDSEYTLKSINQSEIPKDLIKYSNVDFTDYLNSFGDKEVNKILRLQKERIAKYDLPRQTKQVSKPRPASLTGMDKVLQKSFTDSRLAKDLSESYVDLYADPLAWESRRDKSQYVFGAAVSNYGSKFQYRLEMNEDQIKYPGYMERKTHYNFEFVIKRFTENISIVTTLEYNRADIDGALIPARRQEVGLLGFRYHFWENNQRSDFMDLTYTPTYDFHEYGSTQEQEELKVSQGLRHVFSLRIKSKITENISWDNQLTWKPLSDFQAQTNKSSDSQPYLNSVISYFFTRNLSAQLDMTYETDKTYNEVLGEPAENISNKFKLNYAFRL